RPLAGEYRRAGQRPVDDFCRRSPRLELLGFDRRAGRVAVGGFWPADGLAGTAWAEEPAPADGRCAVAAGAHLAVIPRVAVAAQRVNETHESAALVLGAWPAFLSDRPPGHKLFDVLEHDDLGPYRGCVADGDPGEATDFLAHRRATLGLAEVLA